MANVAAKVDSPGLFSVISDGTIRAVRMRAAAQIHGPEIPGVVTVVPILLRQVQTGDLESELPAQANYGKDCDELSRGRPRPRLGNR